MQPGDIVKLKFNGFKQKFQILGVHDVITEDCIHAKVLDEWPMCYEATLARAEQLGLENIKFYQTGYIEENETVSDDHTYRIYLRRMKLGE